MADPAADRRMSDVEALMWTLEKDPFLASTFASVTVLDSAPDVDRLRDRLVKALPAVPRLKWRVSPALGRLAPPVWQDDPDFDIDYHLRRIALPAPGRERDLFDFAVHYTQAPFDRTRPLWEFTVVEGLEGDRAALVQKMHHSITDGEGGVRMSAQFLDAARDAGEPLAGAPVTAVLASEPEPAMGLAATAFDTLRHDVARGLGIAQRALGEAAGLATNPARVPSAATDAVATVRSLLRQVAVTDSARSPLWRNRTLRRHFDVLRVPLDDVQRTAKALGGSVNDVFVAAAAGGAGAYHRAKGADVDELRISMPVSTRTDRSSGGNSFAPLRVLVPAGLDDPVERFRAVHDRLATTKSERGLGLVGATAGLLNMLPTSALVRITRRQVETVDFATSNVRGAPFELFIAGARLEANYPVGPIGGTAWNLTLMSYCGSLDMGLHVDAGAVEDPDLLLRAIKDAFAELISAGS